MSDSNQITDDTRNKNEQQVEILIINGKTNHFSIKSFSIVLKDKSDQKPSAFENNLQSKNIENDSEYEDVDNQEQFDEIIDTSVLTSVSNKSPIKVKTKVLHLNLI